MTCHFHQTLYQSLISQTKYLENIFLKQVALKPYRTARSIQVAVKCRFSGECELSLWREWNSSLQAFVNVALSPLLSSFESFKLNERGMSNISRRRGETRQRTPSEFVMSLFQVNFLKNILSDDKSPLHSKITSLWIWNKKFLKHFSISLSTRRPLLPVLKSDPVT